MAKINEEDIDLLRDRADVIEIVSGYTQLKKASGQTYKGLCPFHSEKTPSFTVRADSGLFHCFGCQEGGNIYQFIQKAESLPFPEAVEWLARKTGFQLRYEEMRPGEQRAAGLKARLRAANHAAAEFFHKTLMDSPDALAARRYLEGRGFGPEVARRWLLGWAPGRDAVCKHLLSRGFKREEIQEAYLGQPSQRDGSLYDFFRERIIFPTWDLNGDVVAFGGRALGDQQPKYLNTGETPVFSKSRVMYGLNRAKSAIARGSALVVEGYTDVIALHEAGITQTVATNGVALADSHFELLKRFTGRVVLMFDADEAGKGATERGFGIHHRIGLEVLVAPLPPDRDPAEVVRDDGPEGIQKILDVAQPLLEFKLEQTISKLPLDTTEAQLRAVREAVRVLGWHPDPLARHQYAFKVARRIGVAPEAVQRALAEAGSGIASGGISEERERDRRVPGHVKVEREALQLLLTYPAEVRDWLDELDVSLFTAPPRREVFERVRTALKAGESIGAKTADQLSPDARALFSELFVAAPPREGADAPSRIDEVFVRLKVFRLEREIRSRRNTLQEVNPLVDAERHDALFTELVALEAERRDLLRSLPGAA